MIYGLKLNREWGAESECVGGAGRSKREWSATHSDVFRTWGEMRFVRYSSHTAPERNL